MTICVSTYPKLKIQQLNLFDREILEPVWEWMEDSHIIVLVGARQVGKTSLLYLLIKRLVDSGVKASSVFYFDLEDFELLNVFNSGVRDFLRYLEAQGMAPDERSYVFVDKINYGRQLTVLFIYMAAAFLIEVATERCIYSLSTIHHYVRKIGS
jgi:predicted AAA+ superfamily ATPase